MAFLCYGEFVKNAIVVNKFEKVSNDDHQMSVVGEGVGTQAPCPGSGA